MSDTAAARLAFAVPLAEEAGRLALGYLDRLASLEIGSKGPQDWVSEADRAVETFLRNRIAAAFPQDGFIGEEHGRVPGRSGFTWVLDPIDGTANFICGLPSWCIVAALTQGARTVAGVIHDPNTRETFTALRGGGAHLGGSRVAVAPARRLDGGQVGVGHSTRVEAEGTLRAIEALLGQGGMYFRNASGALMLAYVAAGRLIGYIEPHMNPWDCVAGLLMVEEAGGRVWPVPGERMLEAGGRVVASGPGVYDALTRIAGTCYPPE